MAFGIGTRPMTVGGDVPLEPERAAARSGERPTGANPSAREVEVARRSSRRVAEAEAGEA
jgi:hypothetical protein